ncbi:MAG: PHP domain-containing protein, partial [Patescibacteria group bacterium]
AKMFYEQLGVDSIEKLKRALESGAIASLPRMGQKSADAIVESLAQATHLKQRIPLHLALPVAEAYVAYMKESKDVQQIEVAGSLRRRLETIGDVDILATGKNAERMSKHFLAYPKIKQVLAAGDTKSSVVLEDDVQVDFRVVEPESFGAALYYFTGSKHHNIHTRTMAIKKNLKINEYGVFKGEKMMAGKTENEIFEILDLPYIPPEIREDQGEIEAGLSRKLPDLIEERDIKGDLHTHSKLSDGAFSIYDMAVEADELGREYIAVSDHMRDSAMIKKQWKEIAEVQEKLIKEGRKIHLLKAAEVDILKNGSLNLDDDILEKLDLVLISVHTSFRLPKKEQTERILRAMERPNVRIFTHPSSRLLEERDEIEVDFEKIIRRAAEKNIAMEINAQPERMDMNGAHAKLCKDNEVKVVINSDAHTLHQLSQMRFGIYMARRGWIEKKDVWNTLPLNAFLKTL